MTGSAMSQKFVEAAAPAELGIALGIAAINTTLLAELKREAESPAE